MGKIFYVMGKSASGKDTIYKKILECLKVLKTVVPYTTRPIRSGEIEGVEYYFTTEEALRQLQKDGKMIESRTYQTAFGPWTYSTINDGQIELENNNYLLIGTLESYKETRSYYGESMMEPIYIEVEDGERLSRALFRERQQEHPKYAELCRRFLADEEDFDEMKLRAAGIETRYKNCDSESCSSEILKMIESYIYNKKNA